VPITTYTASLMSRGSLTLSLRAALPPGLPSWFVIFLVDNAPWLSSSSSRCPHHSFFLRSALRFFRNSRRTLPPPSIQGLDRRRRLVSRNPSLRTHRWTLSTRGFTLSNPSVNPSVKITNLDASLMFLLQLTRGLFQRSQFLGLCRRSTIVHGEWVRLLSDGFCPPPPQHPLPSPSTTLPAPRYPCLVSIPAYFFTRSALNLHTYTQ
jgi:hypothetical protein